ncbi:guanylate kinase [Patescibacteria group bacterium]|nr:guanylate kinase [Patescibacteria group bacterium]MBU1755118.1 guanylate kinase [Patescibacteria group bacterium]
MNGTFFIVMGPTGSGKSTLMKHVIAQFPDVLVPPSFTTRDRRPSEIENSHYTFVDKNTFTAMVEKGEFLEWAEFSGNFYGTLKETVIVPLAEGKVLFTEMEVQGVRQARALLPAEQVKVVFIDAGPWEELEARIRARAPITDEEIAKRKQRYEDEMTYKDEADIVISNHSGEIETAKETFANLIRDAIHAS